MVRCLKCHIWCYLPVKVSLIAGGRERIVDGIGIDEAWPISQLDCIALE